MPAGDLVREPRPGPEQGGGLGPESFGISRGEGGGLVEVGEMADLVANGPARRRGRRFPAGVVQRDQQVAQGLGLGGEVGEERAHVGGHGQRPFQTGGRLSRNAAGPSWASSLR